jgi:hypothetical protein
VQALTVTELSLGAALYFDHELAAEPAPLVALWKRLAKPAGLVQWASTGRTSSKPVPLNLSRLASRVASGRTVWATISGHPRRGFLVLAQTEPHVLVDLGEPPREWTYDLVVVLSPSDLDTIGRGEVIEALCEFAGAVSATAGIVVWSESWDYASALAMLSSGIDLPPEQVKRMMAAYYWRSSWGQVIRGPSWGTFLSQTHVATMGDLSKLPAARIIPLSSRGAFVQATAEPFDVSSPPARLGELRAALAPVLPALPVPREGAPPPPIDPI